MLIISFILYTSKKNNLDVRINNYCFVVSFELKFLVVVVIDFVFSLISQDFDGTLSVKSTARDESPGPGKISPLDRLDEERKKTVELASISTDRYV